MAKNEKMTKKRIISISVAALVVAALTASFVLLRNHNTHTDSEPYFLPPVPIEVEGAKDPLTVGIIYSLTDNPNQGRGWSLSAQGAKVAAYRLSQGGLQTSLAVENDYGTEQGGQEAVKALSAKNVAGIVVASSGSHCTAIAQQAKEENIPVIFLYEDITDGRGVWSFAPQDNDVLNEIEKALAQSGLKHPLVISDNSASVPESMDSVVWDSFHEDMPADDNIRQTISERIAGAREGKTYDSFVVAGNPLFQAFVVTSLEEAGLSFPIFLTQQSANPLFAQKLNTIGTLFGDFRSIGIPDADVLSLTSDMTGNAASSFLAALRALDADPSATTLDSSAPFSQFASYADTLSHDAILAFAHACGKAESCEAGKVSDALASLSLSQKDGVIFPQLNFSNSYPYPDGAFVPICATNQDMRLRNGESLARLYWYSSEE